MRTHPKALLLLLFAGSAITALAEVTDIPASSVIAKKAVELSDHTVTYLRVSPPASLPKRPAPAPAKQPSAAELAKLARLESKTHIELNISATVFLTNPVVTEIKLSGENRDYLCYSNADFRDLRQTSQFEGADAIYSWSPLWISDGPAEAGSIPKGLNLSATETGYIIQTSEAVAEEDRAAFSGLDLIHAFYKANSTKLQRDRVAREAESARLEKELAENPPQKENITVYVWKKQPTK